MERRELLTLLGAGAAGVVMSGRGSAKAAGPEGEDKHEHHAHMKTMGECAVVCNMTAVHCLKELAKEGSENREIHAKASALTTDCQAFCVLAVTLMARHSPLSDYAHRACADACRDCAEACEKGQDEQMKKCAEICRECERACRACCDTAG